MPADRLNPFPPRAVPAGGESRESKPDSGKTYTAVIEVLGGADPDQTAQRSGLSAVELRAAVEVFRHAGRRALAEQNGWWQINVEFTTWESAEQVALEHLAPILRRCGVAWWFIRKHPCWRIRLDSSAEPLRNTVGQALEELTLNGYLQGWGSRIYEPEVPAFGGPVGMNIAHGLFHADSQSLLDHKFGVETDLGPRELSVLLCVTLMRGAGLEWYEQADAWDRVCRERPLPEGVPAERLRELSRNIRVLLFADTTSDGGVFGPGACAENVNAWARTFRSAGEQLRTSGRSGTLERGLRELVSYHVIFHWNRMGLASVTQSALAHAAKAAILERS